MEHYFKKGFFIDIGANDGITLNKTVKLQLEDWNGICIEANPLIFEKLVQHRYANKVHCVCACLASSKNSGKEVSFLVSDSSSLSSGIIPDKRFKSKKNFRWKNKAKVYNYCKKIEKEYQIIKLETISLSEVLETLQAPKTIEYIKLDIEGAEEEVLSDFCFEKYNFLFLIVELSTKKLNKILYNNNFIYVGREGEDDYYINKKNPYIDRYVEKIFKPNGGHKL